MSEHHHGSRAQRPEGCAEEGRGENVRAHTGEPGAEVAAQRAAAAAAAAAATASAIERSGVSSNAGIAQQQQQEGQQHQQQQQQHQGLLEVNSQREQHKSASGALTAAKAVRALWAVAALEGQPPSPYQVRVCVCVCVRELCVRV